MAVTVGNLPVELTGFVGRRSEAAEVRRLLSESHLVTLTGLGGVGKTRLALRVAEDARRAFRGGAWFVDLSELQEPALLDQTVISALDVQDRSVRSPRAVLIEHLGDRQVLLVLDNCEHLIAPVADLVTDLLRSCAGLSVLATSREPLGVPGELVMRVPPLGVPTEVTSDAPPTDGADGDAMALFEQRARAAVPDLRITEDTRAVVGRIVRRLEGLPLPIELAAARLRAMSAEQVLERLNDRFQILTQGSRNAPTRQQTLKWSIDWSYDLCTPQEQWLWRHLTEFAGGFDLDAVEGVLAGEVTDGELLDLVTTLVDKSVLVREEDDTTVRYRMLETLRDYGRALLPDEERTALQRRIRDWYQQFVLHVRSDWIGPRQVDWTTRLDREAPNIRGALEFSLADPDSVENALSIASVLHDYWIVRGRFSEGRYWLDRALGREGESTMLRTEATAIDSVLASLQRDVDAGSALAADVRRAADGTSGSGARAAADFATGMDSIARGDLRRGIGSLTTAVESLRESVDLVRLVPGLYWLGCALYTEGNLTEASVVYEEQLALTESRGEIMWHAMALSDYGSALWLRGDHARGIELLHEALRQLRKLENRFGCAWCFEELAWAVADRDATLAAVLMGAADAQFTAIGSPMATFGSLLDHHDACVEKCRKILGNRRFEISFRDGTSLTLDDVAARALGEQPNDPAPPETADDPTLTPREWQVAELVTQGLTSKAIAEKLVISQRTVDGHVEHIRDKLGFTSRTQIAAWVLQRDNDSGST
ncbi:LuxR C-terminal-related transcriptional regulator [Prescottella defluvii]|uniref:ATP-binding protein n=1 Tax=Prescottella defluvii TaxID=1323361 RepID=UPI0004F3B42C|nr:LuxR C-terminal-related transcriptional regulator [Prescottella defluvii]